VVGQFAFWRVRTGGFSYATDVAWREGLRLRWLSGVSGQRLPPWHTYALPPSTVPHVL